MTDSEIPKTIFVVDDDSFLLNMYATKFEAEGISVSSSGSSKKALEMLRDKEVDPDVILLDIIMPDLNGLDVLKAIRDEGLAKGSAIIMLTNQGNKSDIDTAKEYGVEGYIVKATSIPSEVVSTVKEMYTTFKNNRE